MESTAGVVPYDEIVSICGQKAEQFEVAEGSVADPEPESVIGHRPDTGHNLRYERIVGRFAVGHRLNRDSLLCRQILNDQQFAAKNIPFETTERLEHFANVFEFLPVEAENSKFSDGLGQRIRNGGRFDGSQPAGCLREQTQTQIEWDAPQFSVHGLDAGIQAIGFLGMPKCLVGRPAVTKQRVRNQMHKQRETNRTFKGTAAMAFEHTVQEVIVSRKAAPASGNRRHTSRSNSELTGIPFPRKKQNVFV